MTTNAPKIVTRDEWLDARRTLLRAEKELTHQRDRVSEARRALPWVRVEKPYVFERASGKATLAELFDGKSQLVVYHFMFAPDWEAGCKSCSFWADNFERNVVHLAHRDVKMMAVSRAPREKLAAFAARLGWTFDWASSGDSTFNYDFHVSFTPEELASGEVDYNFVRAKPYGPTDLPGISVFAKDATGAVFHTYSTYGRGVEQINAAYHTLDLVPKGRDEGGKGMAWLRLRDRYED